MDKKVLKQSGQAFAFIAPSLIILIIFSLIPIIASIYLSFTKYNVLSAPEWIGIKNYVNLFKDKTVLAGIKNILVMVAVTVPSVIVISLSLAALIAGMFRNRFGNFVKAALFIPQVASPATLAAVWSLILASKGPINLLLTDMGLKTVNWLGSKNLTLFVICFILIWKDIGYFLVIFYAGIMDIDKNMYEAATVDGATPLQQFFYITIPNLKSVIYLVITLGTIWAFQEFNLTQILTGGGPGLSTVTMVMTVYRAAFKESRMGFASAIAVVLLLIILLVNYIQNILMHGNGDEE